MIHIDKLINYCTRRDILKLASVGAFTASVSGWLDVVSTRAWAQELATRAKAKACIVLFMSGGPAHTYTFDIKTADKCCPYKAIPTSAPGIQVSEYLPHVAGQMHHLALVRGMSTGIADHSQATYLMRTGFRQAAGLVHPHFGARIASEAIRPDTSLPNFVVIKPGSGSLRGVNAGFLPPSFRPLVLKDVAKGIANLQSPDAAPALARKSELLATLDKGLLDEYQASVVEAKMAGYRNAAELMNLDKAREAFKIDKEPQDIRDLYGDTVFGKQCLGARRLVEHGVKFVEVMHPSYWDSHGGAEKQQKTLSQDLDRPMAALLADLHQRGMLDETLVVWMGEFGRTANGNDHYAKAWTTAFAGAGVQGGRAIGRTDAKGMTVEDRPVKVAEFVATIYHTLGIDYTRKSMVKSRPIGFVDGEDARPVHELFA